MTETAERRARVERLLHAARVIADQKTNAGQALRARLLQTTGLPASGIELGIARCLETTPSNAELAELLASTPPSPRAHVLLSANVFVAALRAIAIGVASSAHVHVRASRRDPALAGALHALAPELFTLETELAPKPGEHFWSYGADQTLAELRQSLPRGVWFHPHGAGFGAVVVDPKAWVPAAARAIAVDTALFDQQGCLSPRVVVVLGSDTDAQNVARCLAEQLATLETELPQREQTVAEAAEIRRLRDAAAYAFELFEAGNGWVSLSSELVVPPHHRNLHVVAAKGATALAPFARHLTCIATNATSSVENQLRQTFGGARVVALGEMQRPPLDGPVDRRRSPLGELLQ